VNDHVAIAARQFPIDYNSDVGDLATEIPRDQISRRVTSSYRRDRQRLAISPEEYFQIRHAPVVNVRVGMRFLPATVVRIGGPIRHDVLVNLFLRIDAHAPKRANHFVRTDSRIGGNIAAGIWDSDVRRVVRDVMSRACDRSGDESLKEQLLSRRFVSARVARQNVISPTVPKSREARREGTTRRMGSYFGSIRFNRSTLLRRSWPRDNARLRWLPCSRNRRR
jgi:hypothetical protein